MEKRYYGIVRKWLDKCGYYTGKGMVYASTGKPFNYENIGTQKIRVDLVGVRNVGNKYVDKIEIAAVEVKDKKRLILKHLYQAFGYSIFAHRCYLATTADITKENELDASRMGIGLLRINKKTKNIKEILDPQLMHPDEACMLEILNKYSIAQCTICGCFFFLWAPKTYYKIERSKQFTVFPKLTNDPFDSNTVLNNYKTLRHICQSCCNEFFPDMKLIRK